MSDVLAETIQYFPRMYLGWYLYLFALTIIFALPIPYLGRGKLFNWKGWLIGGLYFTLVMLLVIGGTRAYCEGAHTGFDILGCGIGILVTAFLLNTVVGAGIMWVTRDW